MRPVIRGVQLLQVLWGVNTLAAIALVALLAIRKNFRVYPIFTFYVAVNLIAGGIAYMLYRRAGLYSSTLWRLGWAMQGSVICARALAVAELCKRILARYLGIWAVAWRVLLGTAAAVLLYSSFAEKYRWDLLVTRADRSLELAIAVVIVGVLIFARIYNVQTDPADRLLAVGFCFYFCFSVLNNTILERYLGDYATLWNLLGMAAYLVSMLLWTWALWKTQPYTRRAEQLLPAGVYQVVMPEVNVRLQLLNEKLSQLWKSEATRH